MNYGEEVFGTVNNETGKDYTVMGGAQDATNLNNMLESLKFIDKCNEIRRKEGLGELKVSLELMAKSQYDANNSAYSYNHLEKWGYGENLFWGSSDVDWAFDEWYTKEKALYKADPENNYMNCLHYLNIIKGDYTITGIGLSKYRTQYPDSQMYFTNCASQLFGSTMQPGMKYYTTDEVRELINRYLNGGDLKDAYNAALKEYNEAKQTSDPYDAAYETAKQKTEAAQAAVDEKEKAKANVKQRQEDLKKKLRDLSAERNNLTASISQNQAVLSQERNNLRQAENELSSLQRSVADAQTKVDTTKTTLGSQTKTLDSLKAILKDAQNGVDSLLPSQIDQNITDAIHAVNQANTAYDMAVKQLAKEQEKLDSLTQEAEKKQDVVDQLNADIVRLRNTMEATQKTADEAASVLTQKQAAQAQAQKLADQKAQALADAKAVLADAQALKAQTAADLADKTAKAEQAKSMYETAKASYDAIWLLRKLYAPPRQILQLRKMPWMLRKTWPLKKHRL